MSKNERIMKNSFSRRDFIGSSALVAAALAAPSGTFALPRERVWDWLATRSATSAERN